MKGENIASTIVLVKASVDAFVKKEFASDFKDLVSDKNLRDSLYHSSILYRLDKEKFDNHILEFIYKNSMRFNVQHFKKAESFARDIFRELNLYYTALDVMKAYRDVEHKLSSANTDINEVFNRLTQTRINPQNLNSTQVGVGEDGINSYALNA